MSVTEAVFGPRAQSSSLTGGKSEATVGSGVGNRLFAVHPGIDPELSETGCGAEIGVLVGDGGRVGRVSGGIVGRAVSVGLGMAATPGTIGWDAGEMGFPPEAQAANNSPKRKNDQIRWRIKNLLWFH